MIERAQNWYGRNLKYNSSRNASTLVSDVDGLHKYGPDCSGMVSMAWHLEPGDYGGLNTSTLPSVATKINKSDLQKGDLLDDTIDGHAILFEAWASDGVHFSYWSFGSTPMRHYNGGSGSTEGPLGSFNSGASLAGHPAANYNAYRYNKIVPDAAEGTRSHSVRTDLNADDREDLAVFNDMGNGGLRLFVQYGGQAGTLRQVWDGPSWGYPLSSMRIVTGHFRFSSGSDIAALVDYGGGHLGVWVWKGNDLGNPVKPIDATGWGFPLTSSNLAPNPS